MRARAGLAAAIVVAFFFWARPSSAQEASDTAAQFFRAGLASYERHEYRAAALAFEEAYRLAPRGAAVYNAGRGWEAAGDAARAADAFTAALSSGSLGDADAAYAREHLASLEPALGKIQVTAPGDAAVALDAVERGKGRLTLHAADGAHDVRVRRRDGSEIMRHVATRAGEVAVVEIPDVRPEPTPAAPPPPPPRREEPAAPPSHTRRNAGWVTLGVSVVLGGIGGYTYASFANARSGFEASGEHDTTLHDRAVLDRSATYVLWATGVACAAGGLILVLGAPSQPRVEVTAGPGSVSGTFRF